METRKVVIWESGGKTVFLTGVGLAALGISCVKGAVIGGVNCHPHIRREELATASL